MTDRTGLQNTGELVVGVPEGDGVHLVLPPSLASSVKNIPLNGAIKLACVFGLNGTLIEKDYRRQKVIVAYTPVGYQNWGMALNYLFLCNLFLLKPLSRSIMNFTFLLKQLLFVE